MASRIPVQRARYRRRALRHFCFHRRSGGDGEHEGEYWRAHYRDYLRFYADALAAC